MALSTLNLVFYLRRKRAVSWRHNAPFCNGPLDSTKSYIQRKVTKRELNSHDHYVAGYAYFRLAILRTIQFCIIYVNLHCVASTQLGAPILCIVSTNTISG